MLMETRVKFRSWDLFYNVKTSIRWIQTAQSMRSKTLFYGGWMTSCVCFRTSRNMKPRGRGSSPLHRCRKLTWVQQMDSVYNVITTHYVISILTATKCEELLLPDLLYMCLSCPPTLWRWNILICCNAPLNSFTGGQVTDFSEIV